ncbi:hypothetical protein BD626DRAFT_525113 [Schizophyllum amplum]|uniref:Uncharacterized protein n=1 Tax=Schizophyllum amplum TaxID=97359 RepID=A0A550BSK8_9AGAR|nr:hypothetical protein BD626DRAFT_525113 [Auriculariopsis ampla]
MRNRLCSKCAHDADQFFQTVPFAYRLGFFGALESHGIFGKPTFTTRLLGLGLAWAHGGDDALAQWRDGFALGQEYAPVYIHVHREGAADHEEEEFGVVPVLHAYAYTILYGLFEAGGGQPFNQHESDIAEAVGLNDAFGPHNANFTGDDLRRFCDVYSGRPCARSLLEHAVVNSIKYFMANSDEAQEAADSTDIQRMPEAVYHAIHAFVQDCSDDANAVDQLLASDGEQRIEPDWGNAIPEATCRTDEIPDDPDVSTSPPDALTLSAASAWEVGEDDDNAAFLEPIMDHFLEPVISPLLGELAIFMLGASADYKDGFCDGFLVRSDMQQDDTIIFHAMRATPLDDGLRTMDYIHGYQFGSAFAVTVREMKQPGSKLSSQPFTIAKWTRYLTFELSGTFCYGSEGEQIGAIHMEMDISIWHDAFKHIAQAARYHLEKCHKEYCEGLLGEPDNRVMEWTAVELAVMNALRESVSKAPLDTSTCDQRVYEVAHGFLAPNLRKNGVEDVFRNLEKEKERAGVAQKTTSPPTLASLKAVPSISSISPASPTPSASTSLSATAPVFTPSSAFTSASIAAAALATPPSSTSSTPSSSPPPPTYTPAPQFTTIHAYAAAGSGVSRMLDSHPDNAAFLDKLVRCEAFGIKGLADGMNAAYARCEDAPSTSHGGLYLDAWELGWWMMTTREEDKVEKIWDSERWMTVFEIGIAHYTRRFDTALLRTTDERWNLEDQKDSTYLPLDDILYCFYIKVLSSEGNPDRRRRGQVPAKNVWNPQCRTVFCAVFDALQDIRQSSPGFMRSHQPYRGRSVLYDIVRDRVHAHRNKDHSLFVYSSRRGRPSWM